MLPTYPAILTLALPLLNLFAIGKAMSIISTLVPILETTSCNVTTPLSASKLVFPLKLRGRLSP